MVSVEFDELYVPVLPPPFVRDTAGYVLIVLPGSNIKVSPIDGGVVKVTDRVVWVISPIFFIY